MRTTNKLIYPIVLVLLASACGGRNGARGVAQQQYETVEEGSAAGLTSTIQGPGETLPPITDTNVDTTTALALNPNAIPPASPQASVGVDPAEQPYGGTTVPPAPRVVTPSQQSRPSEPRPTEPQPTETATTATDTDTTTVSPPPAEAPKEEAPPPPADDTSGEQAEEPPPPPPGW